MIEVYFIEGVIGAGKTTQGKYIQNYLQEKFRNENISKEIIWVEEPVQMWIDSGIFAEFCNNMQQNAFKFQCYVLTTRMKVLYKALDSLLPDKDYILLCERSIFSDKYFFVANLFDNQLMTGNEVKMYDDMFSLYYNKILPFNNYKFIYFRPTINESMNRIKKRNRDGEDIPITYQTNLMILHDKFFCDYKETDYNEVKKGHNFFIFESDDFITDKIIDFMFDV